MLRISLEEAVIALRFLVGRFETRNVFEFQGAFSQGKGQTEIPHELNVTKG